MINTRNSKPCHVLMLIENESFPWDRRMRLQAQTLQHAGYEVCVISPKGEDQDLSTFEVVDGVKVYRYPSFWQATGRSPGFIIEYAWAFLCTLLLCIVVWIRDGVDIVHSANPPDLFFLLAWPFKLLGKKFVFDEHDLCPELYECKFQRRDWIYRVLLLLQRSSYCTADLVISTNQSYRDVARERGRLSDVRLAIVRSGPPDDFRRTGPRPELKEHFAHLVVYLGVMGRQDGVDRVVQTAYHLVHTYGREDVLFVLIGKGECWLALQHLARELQVDGIIRFPGRISDELLIDYLSTADVCVAPDPPERMNQLSTMTKIVEYMACQRPIVSFDLLESRRSAGDAAVYVEKDDSKMFAHALNDLLNDPARRERMGRTALERVTQFVGWHQSRKALLEAYARLRGESVPSFESPDIRYVEKA